MVTEIVFGVVVLVTHSGVLCMFVTFNLYVQTFCEDLAVVFRRIDVSLEQEDHLSVKKLSTDAIKLLMKIDE